ncbi:MAG: site-2 protease family protein [Nitrososphaerales archaeon]
MSEEYKRLEFQYGIIMLRTKRFQSLMDRLGKNRISRPVGWFLLYLMPVVAGLGVFLFLAEFLVIFSPTAHQVGVAVRGVTPLAYLGLPGINPYLPIVDGWLALVFAMVVHEGAHGIVARSLGLPVKSSGLLFFLVIPIGAFVDLDEEALKLAKARDSGRVLAAGAGINFALGILFLLLLFSVVSTMTPAVDGIGVTSVAISSPAATAGIKPGDFITAVNGVPYNDSSLIAQASWYKPGQNITLTVWSSGATTPVPLTVGHNPDNYTVAFIGVNVIGYSDLKATVSTYTGSFLTSPILYLCIPTFTNCQGHVPFSNSLSSFYASPYGQSLAPLATVLYWFFFINFSLAIFNALPIFPLDGGQAFKVGLKSATRGRLSEERLGIVTVAVTLVILAIVLGLPLAAYLGLI